MAVLTNSGRRIERATYVPLQRAPDEGASVQRVAEKYAFLSSLAVTSVEADQLAQVARGEREAGLRRALEAVDATVRRPGAASRRRVMAILAGIDADDLLSLGGHVEQLRRQAGQELAESLATIAGRAREEGFLGPAARPERELGGDRLLAWARRNEREQAERVDRLVDLLGGGQTHHPGLGHVGFTLDIGAVPAQAECRANAAAVLTGAFAEQMQVEPVGRLHPGATPPRSSGNPARRVGVLVAARARGGAASVAPRVVDPHRGIRADGRGTDRAAH